MKDAYPETRCKKKKAEYCWSLVCFISYWLNLYITSLTQDPGYWKKQCTHMLLVASLQKGREDWGLSHTTLQDWFDHGGDWWWWLSPSGCSFLCSCHGWQRFFSVCFTISITGIVQTTWAHMLSCEISLSIKLCQKICFIYILNKMVLQFTRWWAVTKVVLLFLQDRVLEYV